MPGGGSLISIQAKLLQHVRGMPTMRGNPDGLPAVNSAPASTRPGNSTADGTDPLGTQSQQTPAK